MSGSISFQKNDASALPFTGKVWVALALAFFIFFDDLSAQTGLDPVKPFKQCPIFAERSGLIRVLASDNKSNIIVSKDGSVLLSFNLQTKSENWKSETSGFVEEPIHSNTDYLFFITSFTNSASRKIYKLNSLSTATGLTSWQHEIPSKTAVRLIYGEDLLFVKDMDNSVYAYRKDTGKLLWIRRFEDRVLAVRESSGTTLKVSIPGKVFTVLKQNGEITKTLEVNNKTNGSFMPGDKTLLLGSSTGEIIRLNANAEKYNVEWNVKIGGAVTGFYELEEGLLVTSLDNFLYMFSPSSGNLKWKRRVGGRINFAPLILKDYAIIVNSGDNSASIIDLESGKFVNQIYIEPENTFSGGAAVSGRFLLFQTYRGVLAFSNFDC